MNLSLLVLLVGVIACTFTNRWNGVLASAKTVPQVLHLDLWPRLWGELWDAAPPSSESLDSKKSSRQEV